jgi:hypothetical protein
LAGIWAWLAGRKWLPFTDESTPCRQSQILARRHVNVVKHRASFWLVLVVAIALLFLVSTALCFVILTEMVDRCFWADFSVAPVWFLPLCYVVSPSVGIVVTFILAWNVRK